MRLYFIKTARLVSLVATMIFALSFALLCAESLAWFAVKLIPSEHAIFDAGVVSSWLEVTFDPSWITCMTSIICILISESILTRLKVSQKS